jgi:hypothetical protein
MLGANVKGRSSHRHKQLVRFSSDHKAEGDRICVNGGNEPVDFLPQVRVSLKSRNGPNAMRLTSRESESSAAGCLGQQI